MGASYYVLAAAEGSTKEALIIMVGNLHQIGYFSSKHIWVLPSVTSSTGHVIKLLRCHFKGLKTQHITQ